MDRIDFLERMEAAYKEAVKLGVNINKAVMFAQAAHESAWGNTGLALKANNLFGIKASSSWKGETIVLTGFEEIKGKNVYEPMRWRKYQNWAHCIKNYSDIINLNSWYKDALAYIDNPDLFLKNIIAEGPSKNWPKGEPGWATDSKYFQKVKNVGREIERLGGPRWC